MNKTKRTKKANGIRKALLAVRILAALVIGVACVGVNPMTVVAESSDAQAIVSRIDALPTLEDLTDSYANEVYNIMQAYRKLPHVDKLEVTNIDKLQKAYNKLVTTGAIIDNEAEQLQRQIEEQQMRNAMEISGQQASQAIEYTFKSDGNENGIASIMIRYTSDLNGDGKGDIPERIVLTSPTNESTPVSNASVAMKDSTMDIALTWAESFVQMDIAYATQGNWTITTSTPVSFTRMNYAGVRMDIVSENERLTRGTGDGEEVVTQEEGTLAEGTVVDQPVQKKSKLPVILLVVAILAILGGIGYAYTRIGNTSDKPKAASTKKTKKAQVFDEDDLPHVQTDEEIIAEMRAEYMKKQEALKNESESSDEDDDDEPLFSQEDIDGDDSIEEYEEGFNNPSTANVKNAAEDEDTDEEFFAESSTRFA